MFYVGRLCVVGMTFELKADALQGCKHANIFKRVQFRVQQFLPSLRCVANLSTYKGEILFYSKIKDYRFLSRFTAQIWQIIGSVVVLGKFTVFDFMLYTQLVLMWAPN